MKTFESEINRIVLKLESLSQQLITGLNSTYQIGVPTDADKVVFWIPLGEQYGITPSYMTNDANEVGDIPNHLKELNSELDQLLDACVEEYDCDDLNVVLKQTDKIFAEWLQKGLEKSCFNKVPLHKVMAINNICAYFDLNTLKLLDDDEMWS